MAAEKRQCRHKNGPSRGWRPKNGSASTERPFPWMATEKWRCRHKNGPSRGWRPKNGGADTKTAFLVDSGRKRQRRHRKGHFRGWKLENCPASTKMTVFVDGSQKIAQHPPERPFPWMRMLLAAVEDSEAEGEEGSYNELNPKGSGDEFHLQEARGKHQSFKSVV